MAEFMPVTACNDPRLKNHEAVEAILARFWLDQDLSIGVSFHRDSGDPVLFLFGYAWPEAWRVPGGQSPAEFCPFDAGCYEDGASGFLELLRELAPHLAERLVVQAIGSTRWNFPLSACEWCVEPNGTDIRIHTFCPGSGAALQTTGALAKGVPWEQT